MEKDVLVRVRGALRAPWMETGPDDVEMIAPGKYYMRGDSTYVLYEEVDEDFGEPIKNTLKIAAGEVSLRKRGPVATDMSFAKGPERMCSYTTPFGSVVLGISARDISVKKSEHELNVRLDYDLEIEYQHTSECVINIDVWSKSRANLSLSDQ